MYALKSYSRKHRRLITGFVSCNIISKLVGKARIKLRVYYIGVIYLTGVKHTIVF